MLNVIENGRRIETPWHAVFPPRGTEKLTASAASPAISSNDQIREGKLPHPQTAKSAYEEVEHITEKRHKVSVVKEIMSDKVITLPADADLRLAWAEFKKHKIRHIPITNKEKRLEGIISDRDILKSWAVHGPATTFKINEVMTFRVLTGMPDTNIREIADAMTVHHIGAVPILSETKHVVGIVTRSDVLRAVVHQAPMDLWS